MSKNKKDPISCPVDIYCRNWDQYNEICQEEGCRASGFRKISKVDADFFNTKRAEENALKILLIESMISI